MWNCLNSLHLQPQFEMVDVAQLVRALDCGSRGRRFEPGLPPLFVKPCFFKQGFFVVANFLKFYFPVFNQTIIFLNLASLSNHR